MTTTNEPKYHVTPEGKIANRQSGQVIPDDEPIFILRGRDVFALSLLRYYADEMRRASHVSVDDEHIRAVTHRIDQFSDFAAQHPERMKVPDTVITDDWKP